MSRNSSVHGCCSSDVLVPEQITIFALCTLTCGSTFAVHRHASLRHVLCSLLGVDPGFLFWNVASLPLSLGGLVLRSASLLSRAAYWASWADSLQMVQQRHPANGILLCPTTFCGASTTRILISICLDCAPLWIS